MTHYSMLIIEQLNNIISKSFKKNDKSLKYNIEYLF